MGGYGSLGRYHIPCVNHVPHIVRHCLERLLALTGRAMSYHAVPCHAHPMLLRERVPDKVCTSRLASWSVV